MITLLPVPCLAQTLTPSESTAATGGEPDTDAEDPVGGEGTVGESAPDLGIDKQVEEIVIEGKRADGVNDEPISVTQFGAAELQNLRIRDVADVADYTPNLEINTAFAASNPTLFIRGVGLKDYNSNSAGAVAIWQDGIQMNSPSAQLFSLYDIESIDVLRGPVGGIGGRNATAGLIRMNSFKPNGQWTSQASFSYGNLNLTEFDGALGFPIFPDALGGTLSARLSGTFGLRDGYVDNVCADWDPTDHGFLKATEEATRGAYDSLEPHDRAEDGYTGPVNNRFIYKNSDAIEAYNAFPGVTKVQTFNLPDGSTVGRQKPRSVFQNPADNTCIVNAEGSLLTQRKAWEINNPGPRDPPAPPVPAEAGTWSQSKNARPLSAFQGLKDTYNDVEYYGARLQLRWEPGFHWDVLANGHWGANRGDSFHLQMVGVEAVTSESDEVITEPLGFFQGTSAWSELNASFVVPFENQEPRGGLFGTKDEEGPKPAGARSGGFGTDNHRSGFYSSDGQELLDLYGGSVNVAYEPDWGRILSITGYEYNSRDIEDEGDAAPTTELEALYQDETWQITQDLRLEHTGDRYDLSFGAFFIHEELTSRNLFRSIIQFNVDQTYAQTLNAWNVGADFHYDFLDEGARPWLYQISFDGGVRYNWEHKDFTLESLSRVVATGVERPALSGSASGTWQAPTGEATFSVLPLENLRIYGKYTRGYKAGHFNAGLTVDPALKETTQSLDAVAPEIIDAVEGGLKWSGFDDRIDVSGAVFRYWYEDLQVFDIVNEAGEIPTQQLLNSDADVLGAELELTLRPLEGLLMWGALGWLDTSFREFLVEKQVFQRGGSPGGGAGGDTAVFNYEGNPLIAAPEWSASGYVEYELPLFGWGSLVPIFDFWYKSRSYLDPQREELISQEPVWIFNARLAYRIPVGNFEIEVAGWVKNFMDTEYRVDVFDLSRQFDSVLEVWSQPRTYGITVSYTY